VSGGIFNKSSRLSAQLVSKIFNLCGHDPPMSQTDGRTDRQHVITRPRFAL